MKFVFLLGGFVGFALVGAVGLHADRRLVLVLRDASLGCLGGAMLFRWAWRSVIRAIDETLVARHAAAEVEAARHPAPQHPLLVAAAVPVRPAAPAPAPASAPSSTRAGAASAPAGATPVTARAR